MRAGNPGVLVTQILKQWSAGDQDALEQLTPFVYAELRRIAAIKMASEQKGHLLQPSALVNEAFVRLVAGAPVDWTDRAHFFAHSARIMRNILVDFARKQHLPDAELAGLGAPGTSGVGRAEFLDIHAALTELAELDERHARIVELRYYGGLSVIEVAAVIGTSEATVNREWQTARAWLFRRLRPKRPQ